MGGGGIVARRGEMGSSVEKKSVEATSPHIIHIHVYSRFPSPFTTTTMIAHHYLPPHPFTFYIGRRLLLLLVHKFPSIIYSSGLLVSSIHLISSLCDTRSRPPTTMHHHRLHLLLILHRHSFILIRYYASSSSSGFPNFHEFLLYRIYFQHFFNLF
jgi:hypothetical protein